MSYYRTVLSCSLYGAYIWAVYGIVEYCFATLLPLLTLPAGWILADWHWPLSCSLMTIYALTGLVGGGVAGLALSIYGHTAPIGRTLVRNAEIRHACATVPLIVAFGINTLLPSIPSGSPLYLGVCLIPLAALIINACTESKYSWLAAMANPWIVSLLLLGPTSIGKLWLHDHSREVKGAALLGCVLMITAVGALSAKMLPRIRRAHGVAAVSLVAVAISVILDSEMQVVSTFPAITQSQQNLNQTAASLPHVILIVLDTVRADHLSVYGYNRDTTPNLERFAAEATVYSSAIATSDMSLGTHASMLTGLYPSWHGAHYAPPEHRSGRPLDERIPTMASLLAAHGYETIAVAGNYGYLGPRWGLSRGNQLSDTSAPIQLISRYSRSMLRNIFVSPTTLWYPELLHIYRRADEVNRSALHMINQAASHQKPLCVLISYMDAHEPYLPPRPFVDRYPRGSRPYIPRHLRDDVLSSRRSLTPDERRELLARYDGAISYIDSQLAVLLGKLKQQKLYDNSLIIIAADHGEAFGERGLLTHGVSVYQDQIHIPLIVKYPKQRNAQRITTTVSQVDILPTVLDVTGLSNRPPLQGVSLLHPDASRHIFSESFPNHLFGNYKELDRLERAVIHGPWKLIASSIGRRELYDLSRDPKEQNNRINDEKGIAASLAETIEHWLAAAPKKRTTREVEIDRDSLERLRSLGYVQ